MRTGESRLALCACWINASSALTYPDCRWPWTSRRPSRWSWRPSCRPSAPTSGSTSSPSVFARYPSAADYAAARAEASSASWSLRSKTTSRTSASEALCDRAARCPGRLKDLVTLAGRGPTQDRQRRAGQRLRGSRGITVDTHFGRLARRFGGRRKATRSRSSTGALIPRKEYDALPPGDFTAAAAATPYSARALARSLTVPVRVGETDPATWHSDWSRAQRQGRAVLPAWFQPLADAVVDVRGEDDALPPARRRRPRPHPAGRGPGRLLTCRQRAHDMRSHAGQPAFPGGAIDPGDVDAVGAAAEAEEETGLDASGVHVVATLPRLRPPRLASSRRGARGGRCMPP